MAGRSFSRDVSTTRLRASLDMTETRRKEWGSRKDGGFAAVLPTTLYNLNAACHSERSEAERGIKWGFSGDFTQSKNANNLFLDY